MTAWHPLTKLLIACATLAIGWLLVSGPSEAPATVAAARLRAGGTLLPANPDPALGAIAALATRLEPPPRETFKAVLERPLFSPVRRPAARPEPPAKVAAEPVEAEDEPAAQPRFRLVGTVTRRGRSEALLARAEGGPLVRLEAGGELDGWVAVAIAPDHVEIERNGTRHRLQILQRGAD